MAMTLLLYTGCSEDTKEKDVVKPVIIGELDPTFNGVGYRTEDNTSGGATYDIGHAVAIDSDDKIVVTGVSHSKSDYGDMVIWRYNSDGTPDTTFNGVGYVTHTNASGYVGEDQANAIVIDSEHRILVAGYSNYDPGYMAVWRYNSDGSLDTTFNSSGFTVFNHRTRDQAYGITIDIDGKILVTGDSTTSDSDMMLWRYDNDGTLDTLFNGIGYIQYDRGTGGDDTGNAVIVDRHQKIIVAGRSDGNDRDMALWRYNSDGTLDTTFNTTGYLFDDSAAGGSAGDSAKAVTIDNNGKIVVVGKSNNGSDYDMVIWRYNEDGSPDRTFNGVGYVVYENTSDTFKYDYGNAVSVDSNNKIIVAGSISDGMFSQMMLWRYNSDGTLDTTFNKVGYVTYDDATTQAYGMAVDSQGKIVLTGYIIDKSQDMIVWRYR